LLLRAFPFVRNHKIYILAGDNLTPAAFAWYRRNMETPSAKDSARLMYHCLLGENLNVAEEILRASGGDLDWVPESEEDRKMVRGTFKSDLLGLMRNETEVRRWIEEHLRWEFPKFQ